MRAWLWLKNVSLILRNIKLHTLTKTVQALIRVIEPFIDPYSKWLKVSTYRFCSSQRSVLVHAATATTCSSCLTPTSDNWVGRSNIFGKRSMISPALFLANQVRYWRYCRRELGRLGCDSWDLEGTFAFRVACPSFSLSSCWVHIVGGEIWSQGCIHKDSDLLKLLLCGIYEESRVLRYPTSVGVRVVSSWDEAVCSCRVGTMRNVDNVFTWSIIDWRAHGSHFILMWWMVSNTRFFIRDHFP